MRGALRGVLPTSFACLVLLDRLFSRRRHADSHVALYRGGWEGGEAGPPPPPRLARTRTTKHEAAHEETEVVAEDGRCCMRARCVITEHLADRRKSPVWSTKATYLLGSTAGVPKERSAALICTSERNWPSSRKSDSRNCWVGGPTAFLAGPQQSPSKARPSSPPGLRAWPGAPPSPPTSPPTSLPHPPRGAGQRNSSRQQEQEEPKRKSPLGRNQLQGLYLICQSQGLCRWSRLFQAFTTRHLRATVVQYEASGCASFGELIRGC
jgi:hypothetical protein